MNINYKQSQFELFPATTGSSAEVGKPRYLFANLTLSIENVVVIGIMTLMTMIFAFSLGVEKGKKIANFSSTSVQLRSVSTKKAPLPAAASTAEKTVAVNLPMKTLPTAASPIEIKQKKEMPVIVSVVLNLPSTSNKPYTIQVASFKDDRYARKEARVLKNKNLDSFVITKGNFFVVCIGRFSKKEEANGFLPKLKRTYNDCLVRRL